MAYWTLTGPSHGLLSIHMHPWYVLTVYEDISCNGSGLHLGCYLTLIDSLKAPMSNTAVLGLGLWHMNLGDIIQAIAVTSSGISWLPNFPLAPAFWSHPGDHAGFRFQTSIPTPLPVPSHACDKNHSQTTTQPSESPPSRPFPRRAYPKPGFCFCLPFN